MATALLMDPEPLGALERLYEKDPQCAERVDALLDVLAEDSGDRRMRRRELRSPPAPLPFWGFVVRGQDEDYLVLWQQRDPDTVVVRYLGLDL